MVNSRAGSAMQLLNYHVATGTEADYTYTPTNELKVTDYSKIIVIISGHSTGTLSIEAIINGVASGNYTNGVYHTGATSTAVTTGATTELLLQNTSAGAQDFFIEFTLIAPTGGDLDILAFTNATDLNTYRTVLSHRVITSATGITSIKIQTSTSTWVAGTQISIYGLKT